MAVCEDGDSVQGNWPACDGARWGATYLVYVDDSGDEENDLLSALCLPVHQWGGYLLSWKKYRRWIERQIGLPPSVELHAEELLSRSKMHATDPISGQEYVIPERIERTSGQLIQRSSIFRTGMKVIGSFSEAKLFTCWAAGPNGSTDLYAQVLLPWLEERFLVEDSWGIVWYDGTAESLVDRHRADHRSLPFSRRVLEDANHESSQHSHFLQMADLCVHAAYKSIRADEGHESRDDVIGAYQELRALIVPGEADGDGFPDHHDERGIRGYLG